MWDLRPKSRDVMVVNGQGFTNVFFIGFISIKAVPGCLPKLENIMKHHSSNIYIILYIYLLGVIQPNLELGAPTFFVPYRSVKAIWSKIVNSYFLTLEKVIWVLLN